MTNQSDVSRRTFLKGAVMGSLGGYGGLQLLCNAGAQSISTLDGFGQLVRPAGSPLALPQGFSATVIARAGDLMSDGLLVPALADGMAAFPGERGTVVLICNHENRSLPRSLGAFGERGELLHRVDAVRFYDYGRGSSPAQGGTTTIVYDPDRDAAVRQFLSLAGTVRNCAGGRTPWNSWISCEEDTTTPDELHERSHGWCFEVPSSLNHYFPIDPEPIRDMGRFYHEAVCVHPRTGIVYLTEDRNDGLIYRFIPSQKPTQFGDLARNGGRLQALRIIGEPSRDLRNWETNNTIPVGSRLQVEWVDLDDVEAPKDDLRLRGFNDHGAARFARLEGTDIAGDSVFFICTSGGKLEKGQVWRYTPSSYEGTSSESESPASLELFVEPDDPEILNMPDNCAVAPWGDLMLCEDNGSGTNRLISVTPEGKASVFAANILSRSELAGVCFSPDGETLFVNIQGDGLTLAVRGPWPNSSA